MKIIGNTLEMLNMIYDDKIVGFVPTMGNLHAGHISLINKSQAENDITVVSIFVNPTQFNNIDDFEKYPKTLETDKKLLVNNGVDILYLPEYDEIYPDQYTISISDSSEIANIMEGQVRPGHFSGVLTVVAKLLQIVRPHNTYLGKKDYQQWKIIENLVKALFIPTKIIGCDIVRNEDLLPLSSRNNRLSPENLKKASKFSQFLMSKLNCDEIKKQLESEGFCVEYILEYQNRRFGAVWIADVRLIDNCEI